MHDAAHDGVFQMGMQIDEARHERCKAEVLDLLVGIAELEHVDRADVTNNTVSDEHRTMLERLGGNRKNVLCAQ